MDYEKKRKQNENEESNSVTSPWSKRKALGGEETNHIVVMSDRYTIFLFFKNLFIFVYFDRLNCLIEFLYIYILNL
jgi:hypothetical protein